MKPIKRITAVLFLSFLVFSEGHAQILETSWKDIVNKKEDSWFQSKEAEAIAENVLLFQRDIGGWPKNMQMQEVLSEKEKADLLALKPNPKDCTIDNGATILEMLFLSKIYKQKPKEPYKTAFLKGLDYLLMAQYENGGWPQFFPLKKGYTSHITYNDDAMANVMNALRETKDNTGYYAIRPPENIRQKTSVAFDKGIDCILKTQYRQKGILTGWCAQHDEFTLLPADARSFELASLSGQESAKLVLLLMDVKNPSNEIITAVNSAVGWLEKTKITNLKEERIYDAAGKMVDKKMIVSPYENPIWPRFMELDNNKPFFCDRDGVKKDSISQIGIERRVGYAWYSTAPQKALDRFKEWKKQNFVKKPADENNVTVAKDGSGDYTSIQEAINNAKAFPDQKITIFIKNGIYKEKVKIHHWNTNLQLIGESQQHTIIIFDDYFNKIGLGRNSTFYTYTLLAEADDVLLKNLTIENSSGEVGQAVALSVTSNRVGIVNCKLLGNQDTLYATGTGKQYYKNCYIEGTTDFIFGSATAFFEDCRIHSKKDSYITAASTPKDSKFGYVFKNCRLTAADSVSKVYLGRPWRDYAKTVFIQCDLGTHILAEGWHNWSKPEAEKTSFYAEYKNTGSGSKTNARVGWSHQLSKKEARCHTIKNVLGVNKSEKLLWYENL